jgi:3-oxoacyl-[acyl-carrier protein] reductase
LGAALALDLAEHGADVVVSYHSSAVRAEETCTGVRALGRRCATVQVDLTDAGDAGRLVGRAAAELGGLDALVYVASGPFVPRRPDEVDEAAWSASLDTIAKGFFFTAAAAYRALTADPRQRSVGADHGGDSESPSIRGVIVAITDVGGEAPWAAFAAHSAAKAAQIALVKALAKAWGPDGVRVCGVAPGPLDLPDDRRREASERAAGQTVVGRLQRRDEVAAAVRFCLENDYMTGQNLIADGGFLLK